MRDFDIVSLGEPIVEFRQTRAGEPAYLQGFGGDTSNVAVAAARQGARVAYVTRLGADAFGAMVRGMWRDEAVDASAVAADPSAHTGVCFVTRDSSGEAWSDMRAGSAASRMQPADVPVDLIQAARYLHSSGISQAISPSACDAVFCAIDAARQAGVKVCYDPNLRLRMWPIARARAITIATATQADYFLPSLEDARALSGRDTPETVVRWAHELGAAVVCVKLGPKGVLVSDGVERELIPGFKVKTVDATGAGDCFDGALLARLAAGDTLWEAARYANAAAALATTGYGAIGPLPRPDAVRSLLATMQD